MKKPRKPVSGAIFEFDAPGGFVYGQYVLWHDKKGFLVRAFQGLHPNPLPPEEVVCLPEQFVTFLSILGALRAGHVRVIGQGPIPSCYATIPLFRRGFLTKEQREAGRAHENVFFWDGTNDWRVGKITEEQRKMPILITMFDDSFVESILTGWRHEHRY